MAQAEADVEIQQGIARLYSTTFNLAVVSPAWRGPSSYSNHDYYSQPNEVVALFQPTFGDGNMLLDRVVL